VSAEFSLHVADCGYRVTGPVVTDGHFRRTNWKPDSGKGDATWYIGWSHDDFSVITWGDFRDDFREIWTSRNGSRLSQAERAMLKADLEKARVESAKMRDRMAAIAVHFADQMWSDAQLSPESHPYLTKKGITGDYLRWRTFDGKPELLVPLRDATASLRNLQRISADGTKRFVKNGPVCGLWWRSGPMPPVEFTGDIAVVEGVATAETVRALSGLTTFAAITAGNLPAVVKWMRSRWPAARILIGADDDRWEKDGTPRPAEKNIGRKKATEAAEGTRALIILPAFNNLQSRGTDWNDLAAEEGLEATRAKWIGAATVATLDRQVAGMSDTEYAARRPALMAAYRNAGAGAMGSRQLDQRRRETRGSAAGGEDGPDERPPYDVLTSIVEDATLWHNQFGIAFATVPHDGITINARIEGAFFRDWLRVRYEEETNGGAPFGRETMNAIVERAASTARLRSPQMHSYYRFGVDESDGSYWLDLGRKDWKMVRWDGAGWKIFDECPIKFIHSDGDCSLPLPERNPALNGMMPLWELLNIGEADRCLVAGFILGAMMPNAPCFGIDLYGGQGTAKSTATKMLRRLLDPQPAATQTLNERNADELGLTCVGQWIPCFENISRLEPEVQDVLCSLTTDLAAKSRKLYTDGEIVSYELRRPWIINGINNVCTRNDLAERAVPVALLPSPNENRKRERVVWAKFYEIRPHILAVLLDAAVMAQKEREFATSFLESRKWTHRMADALEWITAGEEAMGFKMGDFIQRLNRLQEESGFEALDGNPVVAAIEALVNANSRGFWCGTHEEILETMHEMDSKTKSNKYLPHDSISMGNWIRREADRLRKSFGLAISERRQARKAGRRQHVREIQRIEIPTDPDDDTDLD
jgi:phage/plasmid primase-like uncharacterized protein